MIRKVLRMKDWIMTHLLELAFGLASTVMGYAIKRLAKKISEQESMRLGVQALLRDRIVQSYNLYMEKGYCPIYALESINAMANEYFNLGGNGVIHNLIDKLNELPTEIHKEEE